MSEIEITKDVAVKVLGIVDAGLSKGLGVQRPGEMCVEAAVCYALGLPHGDDPQCVANSLRRLKIRLNDARWSSNTARAKGLRRLALAQLGSKDVLDEREFVRRAAKLATTLSVPAALRAAASVQQNPTHKAALFGAAMTCERDGTRGSASAARKAAADAAYAAAYAAATAAAYADAATAAAYAYADAAADAVAAYAVAAADAADAAAYAAVAVAAADAAAADADARDKPLADFAEGVVRILIEMNAPGCQWLDLTEAA